MCRHSVFAPFFYFYRTAKHSSHAEAVLQGLLIILHPTSPFSFNVKYLDCRLHLYSQRMKSLKGIATVTKSFVSCSSNGVGCQ